MGEAEDIVLRNLAGKKTAADTQKTRNTQEFVRQLGEITPRVIAHFRTRDYSIESSRTFLEVNGEQRVAWRIGSHCDDYIYLLADGTFSVAAYLEPGCPPMDAQTLGAICDHAGNQHSIIRRLREMLTY